MATKRKSRTQRSPISRSRTRPHPDSSPGPDPIARTPFSARAVTPAQSLKSVLLCDWWLKRARGKGLAVAGFETKGGSGVRLFSSGEISKRHDSTTLETMEGITVSICGLINRLRTLQNGFSLEVCNHFLLGFPYYWEDYATPSCGQEEMAEEHDQTTEARTVGFEDASASPSTVSFDDIPVSRFYDLLMSPLSGSKDCFEKKTLDEVLGRLRHCTAQGNPCKEQSDRKCETSTDSVSSGREEVKDHNKTLAPTVGVKTRGMLRLTKIQEEENVSIVCALGTRIHNAPVLSSEETRNTSAKSSRKKKRGSLSSKSSSVYDDYSELASETL